MPTINQQKWKKVEYSKKQIIKAGETIVKQTIDPKERLKAIQIIDNWRAAHAYPMHVMYMHLRQMAGSKNIIVAERLKRLDSIIAKLQRENEMSLWRVQDLGGCRFIVPNLIDVYTYSQKYEKSRKRHILQKENDYIKNPKLSGYRSLHLVYKYHSDHTETYNRNILIEIQYRTHLQHLWATAVETVGLFTKQAIKSGEGNPDVKQFFVLVSSLFALKENCPVVPGTSTDVKELVKEIKRIDKNHYIIDRLKAIKTSMRVLPLQMNRKAEYFLLILNYNTRKLRILFFTPNQIEEANDYYSRIEEKRDVTHIDAVLVRVSSFNALKIAYPNYFSDISEFLEIVSSYVE